MRSAKRYQLPDVPDITVVVRDTNQDVIRRPPTDGGQEWNLALTSSKNALMDLLTILTEFCHLDDRNATSSLRFLVLKSYCSFSAM